MRTTPLLGAIVALVLVTGGAVAQSAPPQTAATSPETPFFGGAGDIDFAGRLWQAMRDVRLVGPGAIEARPYEGVEPHGAILVTLQTEITVGGRAGTVIVKKNYMGVGLTIEAVSDNPDLNLAAITVMFRREAGYDAENRNWFWAKYGADGALQANPVGVRLAGRIAKNPEDGCIACHRFAPGDDYVFLNDRFATAGAAP